MEALFQGELRLRIERAWYSVRARFDGSDPKVLVRSAFVGAAIGLVGAVSLGIVLAYLLSGSRPPWWPEINSADPDFVQTAERVHNGLASELHRGRPGTVDERGVWVSEPWRMAVATPEANAWLAVEMRRWMEDRAEEKSAWLSDVRDVCVSFQEDRVLLGASMDTPEGSRYLWTTLEPQVDTWGSLWLRASTVHVGRLPMPAPWVLEGARSELKDGDGDSSFIPSSAAELPETQELIRTLLGERPMLETPMIRLIDGRRVRLLSIEARGGKVVFLCRTERPATG
ncbi:MAG: hypothetical protein AAGB51_05970 [Planctomycetota bacterium]